MYYKWSFVCECEILLMFMKMLNLNVNNFINSYNKDEYKTHMTRMSRMDINDIIEAIMDFCPIVKSMLATDNHKPFSSHPLAGLSSMPNVVVWELGFRSIPTFNITPISILPLPRLSLEPLGTLADNPKLKHRWSRPLETSWTWRFRWRIL